MQVTPVMRMEEGRQTFGEEVAWGAQELASDKSTEREKDEMEWNLLPLLSAQNRSLIQAASLL